MKFKEIKPGMVIHCPKEEDARALLEHLAEIGYKMGTADCDPLTKMDFAKANMNYHIDDFQKRFFILCTGSDMPGEVTEFSDLIEPEDNLDNNLDNQQDNEMTAVEVLEWLYDYKRNPDDKKLSEIFDVTTLDALFCWYDVDEIIRRITAYEAAKKAPKPVKVKEGYYCDIYTEDEQILNYIMYGVDEQTAQNDAREKAMKNTIETGSLTFADVKFVCEEDES